MLEERVMNLLDGGRKNTPPLYLGNLTDEE